MAYSQEIETALRRAFDAGAETNRRWELGTIGGGAEPWIMDDSLGFCDDCFRVRRLAVARREDEKGNLYGTCTGCARDA